MGKVAAKAEAMTKKRKKKGRPSLLDLQKRAIKQELQQQQQQRHTAKSHQTPLLRQNPNSLNSSARRSARRNAPSDEEEEEEEEDDDERKEKKLKPLLGLNSRETNPLIRSNSSASNSHGSGSNADAGNPEAADVKNRQIGGGEKFRKATDTLHGLSGEPGPTTPLPDKKLLLFILDRLQKKDTYGVFSDPVDPEELPDYHDIILHPMDFSTVRRKLDDKEYLNLEQFEKDVFLICSNAMQYNPPDTVYFRQARSIQELAKKDFENLRQDSDDGDDDDDDGEPEPKVEKVARRGRPPGSGKAKKSLEKSPLDRAMVEFSPDATLATGGDNSNGSNGYNFRKTTLFKPPVDMLGKNSHGSHNGDTYSSWVSEWENEFPASVLKAVMKHVKKPATLDENRRDSYNPPAPSTSESFSLNPFDGELKQLVAVGLSAEYGYARSVARFAADLGPTAWTMASKRIQRVLPMGVEFGPGWVGDNDLVQGSHVLSSSTDKNPYGNSVPGDPSNSHQPSTSTANTHHTQNIEDQTKGVGGSGTQGGSTSLNDNLSRVNAMPPPGPVQQQYIRSGGLPPMGGTPHRPVGLVSSSNPIFGPIQQGQDSENASPGNASSAAPGNQTIMPNSMGFNGRPVFQGPSPYDKQHQQESIPFPTDLNVGFLSPSSPSSSGVPIGSPQQPDLALQL